MTTLTFIFKVILCMLLVFRRRRLHQRKWWIHPILSNRKREGMFTVMHHKLRKYPDKFFEFYRMSEGSFDIFYLWSQAV
jgi:hypothetical protein